MLITIIIVHNYVDNVENALFSTVISLRQFSPGPWQFLHIPVHIWQVRPIPDELRHSLPEADFPENRGQWFQFVGNFSPSAPGVPGGPGRIFVDLPQIFSESKISLGKY